jgi:hypothetical protein
LTHDAFSHVEQAQKNKTPLSYYGQQVVKSTLDSFFCFPAKTLPALAKINTLLLSFASKPTSRNARAEHSQNGAYFFP